VADEWKPASTVSHAGKDTVLAYLSAPGGEVEGAEDEMCLEPAVEA
jgi:hypothetical protein